MHKSFHFSALNMDEVDVSFRCLSLALSNLLHVSRVRLDNRSKSQYKYDESLTVDDDIPL